MPRYLIERELPGAAEMSPEELQKVALHSCDVLRALGPDIQWLQSYVTADRITCVYIARNEELIREHARRGQFPCDRILEVAGIFDPTTAEPRRPSPEEMVPAGTTH
jgi:hypothetical protein